MCKNIMLIGKERLKQMQNRMLKQELVTDGSASQKEQPQSFHQFYNSQTASAESTPSSPLSHDDVD